METQPTTPADLLPKILEMSELPKAAPITPRSFDETKKRRWIEKWIGLQSDHHPSLKKLENEIYFFCCDYARVPHRGKRLLIHGDNGTGKSHVARAVYRWASRIAITLPLIMTEEGASLPTVAFLQWPLLIKRLKPPYEEHWRLDDVEKCSLLVIDDIGAEHVPMENGVAKSGFANEKLYLLLERREWLWTLMTTNITGDKWEERFERRIASRFLRNTSRVNLESVPDFKSL